MVDSLLLHVYFLYWWFPRRFTPVINNTIVIKKRTGEVLVSLILCQMLFEFTAIIQIKALFFINDNKDVQIMQRLSISRNQLEKGCPNSWSNRLNNLPDGSCTSMQE